MERILRIIVARLYQWANIARDWLIAAVVIALLRLLALLPADRAIGFAQRMARKIGPKTSRHKLALANLANAFPEKSEAEREAIASDMWANMASLAAEYVFLDQIFDYDPDAEVPGRIEVEGADLFRALLADRKPFIVFTAHTGNFELLPIAAATFNLDVTALFRPPNNPYIAKHVFSARRTRMGALVPSHTGAAFALARALDDGGGIGMLVDQKFHKGEETLFFGHKVRTNPLLAKLARQFDCPVYPARSIRLPNGRFRLEIEQAVELPRKASGAIDVAATAQMLNDKVESWVREYPGQWQWFHDRWAIKHTLK